MPVTNRAELDYPNLPFTYTKTDINVRYTWKDGRWDEGVETESEILPLHIAATAIHYGQAAFEGLKVYETADGRVQCFRLNDNAERLIHSGRMLMMQAPPVELFRGTN